MSDEQPEVRWAPIEPKPKNRGRIWLIVGIGVAALAIVGALLFFLLPRGDAPEPGASGSPGPSSSPTETSSPTPGATSTTDPSEPPAVTPPAPVEPTIDAFRDQVSGWLTDAPQGLDIIAGSSGTDALSVVDSLVQDAQRMSDTQPPSSLDAQWRDGVSAYAERLNELRTAISESGNTSGAVEAARSAVQNLRSLVGL